MLKLDRKHRNVFRGVRKSTPFIKLVSNLSERERAVVVEVLRQVRNTMARTQGSEIYRVQTAARRFLDLMCIDDVVTVSEHTATSYHMNPSQWSYVLLQDRYVEKHINCVYAIMHLDFKHWTSRIHKCVWEKPRPQNWPTGRQHA